MTFVKKLFAITCAVLCFAASAFASPADDKLFAAIEAGSVEGVRAALDAGADINALDRDGLQTPLRAAVENKQLDIARELVERGADINATDVVGGSAFLYAATLPGSSEFLTYLKGKGANIYAQDFDGDQAWGGWRIEQNIERIGWQNGTFHEKETIFSETVSAGKVYELTAPIVPDLNDSGYFLIFTSNDADEGTVEWYLHEDGVTGRQYRSVWRFAYMHG